MSDRIRLDDLTSDQYDALCDERDRLRAAVDAVRQWATTTRFSIAGATVAALLDQALPAPATEETR